MATASARRIAQREIIRLRDSKYSGQEVAIRAEEIEPHETGLWLFGCERVLLDSGKVIRAHSTGACFVSFENLLDPKLYSDFADKQEARH